LIELFEPMQESAIARSVVGAKAQSTPRSIVAARKQTMSCVMPPPTATSVWPRRRLFATRWRT